MGPGFLGTAPMKCEFPCLFGGGDFDLCPASSVAQNGM